MISVRSPGGLIGWYSQKFLLNSGHWNIDLNIKWKHFWLSRINHHLLALFPSFDLPNLQLISEQKCQKCTWYSFWCDLSNIHQLYDASMKVDWEICMYFLHVPIIMWGFAAQNLSGFRPERCWRVWSPAILSTALVGEPYFGSYFWWLKSQTTTRDV